MANSTPLVLLVDDDPDFLEITQGILEAGGYRVACAHDPEAAMEALAKERPQVVITDLMMRSMGSGFSLARRIKDAPHCRDVPVIIVTAAGARLGYDFAPRNPGDLAAMRADAFFEKPVLPGDLLAKVADLLGVDEREGRS